MRLRRVGAAGVRVVGVLVTVAFAAHAQPSARRISLGGRDVVVWAPSGTSSARQPVIIFSHGFGGCARQSTFLTEALAAHGYWVFAPNHKDARCGGTGSGVTTPEVPFRKPQDWSERTFADRRDDIQAIQQALATSPEFASRVDLTRLGYVGHSLGGYAMVGLAGGWASWRTPGVKAVLALSPYVEPYVVHRTLGGLAVPIMYQGGTLDFGITPSLMRSGGAYDASPSPKYFVELAGAGHLAWTDLRGSAHDAIDAYAIAFLDHYVLGTPASAALTEVSSGVAELRYDSELGSRGSAKGRSPRVGMMSRIKGVRTIVLTPLMDRCNNPSACSDPFDRPANHRR